MNELNHIAFIMDGNGRWGKKLGKGRNFGHLKGVETVKKIVRTSIRLNIPVITFYVFSTENWKRPKKEKTLLFKLIKNYFLNEIDILIKQGIRINILGEIDKFSSEIKSTLRKSVYLTKKNKKIIVNLALNYGSKHEMIQAFKKMHKKFTIKEFQANLYTKNMPDPDILVRTGGYQRLSNFLLWQLAYTELFFLKKLWPDFSSNDLIKIIKKFKRTQRNYGSL